METLLVFLLTALGVFISLWVLVGLYVWPALRALPRRESLRLLLIPHMFRFIGLSFLVVGVVSPAVPAAFSVPAAWGDFGAAVLALLAVAALSYRWPFAIQLVWIMNLWGTADLLNNYFEGYRLGIDPGAFGAAFYIPTVVVPLLLVSHVLSFAILTRREDAHA